MQMIIDRAWGTTQLSQKNYVNEVLEKFDMEQSKSVNTPMHGNLNFDNDEWIEQIYVIQ